MIRYGLIREEQDLLCRQIYPSILMRHYWSLSLKSLEKNN